MTTPNREPLPIETTTYVCALLSGDAALDEPEILLLQDLIDQAKAGDRDASFALWNEIDEGAELG